MLTTPDLSLSPKSPTQLYNKESHNTDKLAVYALVDLGDTGIQGLVKALEHNDNKLRSAYRLAPKYDFNGESLKSVYNYHLKLGSERSHHPTLFIVAHDQDYGEHGVLLVNLETDLKCSVDICRMKATEALAAGMNIAIANMDWEDFKEDELPLTQSGGGSEKGGVQIDQTKSQSSGLSYAPSYVFSAYTTAGADMTEIRTLLEPDWRDKTSKTELCQSVCSYTDYPDTWNELIKHHPWNCLRNPRLHRQWCICADNKHPKEEGVLLVHIDWNGNIDRNPSELFKVGLGVDVTTERSSVENAIASLAAFATREQSNH